MPTRLEKLTDKQIARMPEWVNRWIGIGLSTDPANWASADKAIRLNYALAKLPPPKIVLRMDSPLATCLGGALAVYLLGQRVESQVASQVESQVRSQVWSQVASQVRSQGLINYRCGNFWASWYAYVSFFRDVCGWKNQTLTAFANDEALALAASWQWYHEDVAVICNRPSAIRRDAEGRLHAEVSPAIEWRDGWALRFWHGVHIPDEWPKALTPKIALTWKNIEQRRAACEMLGWETILSELNARSLDKDADPLIGELIEVEIPGVGRERFLRVVCGTGRRFALPVPPNMTTALEANAWTFGMDGKSFIKPEVRT